MRVLIVEDDPVLGDGLTRSLRQSDYAVDCVSDGGEADHVLASQNYDLVKLARDIDLGFDGPSNGARVEGDSFLLKEMLNNLLDNAVRYTQTGGQLMVRVVRIVFPQTA